MREKLPLLFLLTMTAFTAQGQDTIIPPTGPLAPTLQPALERPFMAGAAVLAATADRVIDLEAAGYADLDRKIPMRTDSVFWIASMTKAMTASAFMTLVDAGQVRLDDPVEKYLPEFKAQMVAAEKSADRVVLVRPSHPITLRNLLSHTSGLTPISPLETPRLDVVPLAVAVRSHAMLPLNFQPDTAYLYSNAGINTIGRIIEVVSHEPYAEFMQRRLLGPLGMADTTFWPNRGQLGRLARTYRFHDGRLEEAEIDQLTYPLDERSRQVVPAGGLFSTARDVARFCQMLLRGGEAGGRRLLSEAAVREMTRVQTGELPIAHQPGNGYGFGWDVRREPGIGDGLLPGAFWHAGAAKTHMAVDPGRGLITVLMVQCLNRAAHEEDQALYPYMSAAERLVDGPPR